jgi:hypothetical protein
VFEFDYYTLSVDLRLQPAFSLSLLFHLLVPSHGLLQRNAIQQRDQILFMVDDVDKILVLNCTAITELHFVKKKHKVKQLFLFELFLFKNCEVSLRHPVHLVILH